MSDERIEELADLIEAELDVAEAVLTSPQQLRRLKALRIARKVAAIEPEPKPKSVDDLFDTLGQAYAYAHSQNWSRAEFESLLRTSQESKEVTWKEPRV